MREKRKFSVPAIGGTSLFVIFAVLCLTAFAVLSLSTAQAGKRISQKSADAIQEYYQLDKQAEEDLAHIRNGEIPKNVSQKENLYSYSEKNSSGTQKLDVIVRMNGKNNTILRWQLVSTAKWEADEQLPPLKMTK